MLSLLPFELSCCFTVCRKRISAITADSWHWPCSSQLVHLFSFVHLSISAVLLFILSRLRSSELSQRDLLLHLLPLLLKGMDSLCFQETVLEKLLALTSSFMLHESFQWNPSQTLLSSQYLLCQELEEILSVNQSYCSQKADRSRDAFVRH